MFIAPERKTWPPKRALGVAWGLLAAGADRYGLGDSVSYIHGIYIYMLTWYIWYIWCGMVI